MGVTHLSCTKQVSAFSDLWFQHLMRSHLFFPIGSYMRNCSDKSNCMHMSTYYRDVYPRMVLLSFHTSLCNLRCLQLPLFSPYSITYAVIDRGSYFAKNSNSRTRFMVESVRSLSFFYNLCMAKRPIPLLSSFWFMSRFFPEVEASPYFLRIPKAQV